MGGARPGSALVALALVIGACTTATPPDEPPDEPARSSEQPGPIGLPEGAGERVAIIIGPPSMVANGEAAALRAAADAFAADPPDGVAGVRVVQATSADFALDLADLAVDDGFEVVCIVGAGTADLLVEQARIRREVRFCGTDGAVAEAPVNVTTVAVDPAALVELAAAAVGPTPGTVGLLVGEELGDVEQLGTAFSQALPPVLPTTTPEAASSPSPAAVPSPPPPNTGRSIVTVPAPRGAQPRQAAVEELVAAAPAVAAVLAATSGDAAASTLGAGGSSLVVLVDWAVNGEGELPGNVLVSVTVDWSEILRRAIAAARTDDAPHVSLVGVGDGVLGALPGQTAEAPAAVARALAVLQAEEGA